MRKTALKILHETENRNAYLNLVFNDVLSNSHLSSADVGFVKELVFGVFRNKILLDYIIRKNSSLRLKKIDPKVLNILRMGAYQIFFMDKVPPHAAVSESVELTKKNAGRNAVAFVNAVLRSMIRTSGTDHTIDLSAIKEKVEYLSVKYSYPLPLAQFFVDTFGEDAESLMESGNAAPNLCVRINTLKTTKEAFCAKLDALDIKYEDTPYSDCGLYLFGATEEKRKKLSGLFTVQDQSSQLVSLALDPKPHEFVLDLCAAPGGKTTHIAELMKNTGRIYASDIYESRLKSVDHLADNLGISIIKTTPHDACVIDQSLIGKVDKVLADVPCSGLGIIRRKPDIKYKENITDFKEINHIQYQILYAAYRYLKSGGSMVYSTCTLNPSENIEMINTFLKNYPDMKLTPIDSPHILGKAKEIGDNGYIELFPDKDKSDGFFICHLTKL